MFRFFQISRSGYYDFVHRLGRPEKDAALAEIIAEQRERSFRTHGCRRMCLELKKRDIHRDPKTILRIMEKYGLLSEIRRRRKWQQMGQQVHKYENLLNREFHADRPNRIFLTPTRSKAYYIYFYNHECIQLKNWSGAAHAAPLRLKLHISLYRDLFVLSAQAGAVHDPVGPVQPGFFAPIDNVPVRQI